MTFSTWLDTLVEEKGLDTDYVFTEYSDDPQKPLVYIPLKVVIEAVKKAPEAEQAEIKKTLVGIDHENGDVMHLFDYLAAGMAKNRYEWGKF
jgi:hypothetical protein